MFISKATAAFALLSAARIALGAAASNFAASCSSESLSGTTLSAECLDENGGLHFTSINLDSCVGNDNGNLVCGCVPNDLLDKDLNS